MNWPVNFLGFSTSHFATEALGLEKRYHAWPSMGPEEPTCGPTVYKVSTLPTEPSL